MKRQLPVVLFQDTAKKKNCCMGYGPYRRVAWLKWFLSTIIMIQILDFFIEKV